MWLPLYPFNMYNIQNPKTYAPRKENKKCQFPFFNSVSNSKLVLGFKTANSKVLVKYKVLDLKVLFPWP